MDNYTSWPPVIGPEAVWGVALGSPLLLSLTKEGAQAGMPAPTRGPSMRIQKYPFTHRTRLNTTDWTWMNLVPFGLMQFNTSQTKPRVATLSLRKALSHPG